MRQPGYILVEAGLNDRTTLEMGVADRATLGVRMRFLENTARHLRLTGGLDGVLAGPEEHLQGVSQEYLGEASRLWLLGSWEARHGTLAAGAASRITDGEVHWSILASGRIHGKLLLPLSLGWEGQYDGDDLHQAVGFGIGIKSIELSAGLSEFQSWIVRQGKWGWFSNPAPGSHDGRNNPGVWLRAAWSFPPEAQEHSAAPAVAEANGDAASLTEALARREVHRDLAELATLADLDEEEPIRRAVLRRQILSEGRVAREELWYLARAADAPQSERLQALATLDAVLSDADLDALSDIAKDTAPVMRQAAARAMLHLASPKSLKSLAALAKDPDASVRAVAEAAKPATPPAAQDTAKSKPQATPSDTAKVPVATAKTDSVKADSLRASPAEATKSKPATTKDTAAPAPIKPASDTTHSTKSDTTKAAAKREAVPEVKPPQSPAKPTPPAKPTSPDKPTVAAEHATPIEEKHE